MSKRPNLFIVGAPRCGTTTLHFFLAQHPDVFMSSPKEPHHFCGDIHRAFEEYQGGVTDPLFRTEAQYMRLFDAVRDERVRGESSVYYLYSDEAPDRIAEFAPDARVIVMIREPIEFMRSLHAKLRWAGDEDCTSFERAIELEPRRMRGLDVPSTVRFPGLLEYTRYARFSQWIERYRERFDPERTKLILLDDFQRDPEAVFHSVLDFVGVERIPLPPRVERNANVEPRFAAITRYVRKRGARKQGRFSRWLLRLNERHAPRRAIDPAMHERLKDEFRPEVERLSALFDRDLRELWYGAERSPSN